MTNARYRVGVSGDTVIAHDTATSTVHTYRKRKIEDGTHHLDMLGSITTVKGRVVGVSKPAEATGYTLRDERGSVVLSRKSDPRWRLDLGAPVAVRIPGLPAHAVLKLRGNALSFVEGGGMFRLDPVRSEAAGKSGIDMSSYSMNAIRKIKADVHSHAGNFQRAPMQSAAMGNPGGFDLGDDFAP